MYHNRQISEKFLISIESLLVVEVLLLFGKLSEFVVFVADVSSADVDVLPSFSGFTD